MIVFSDLFQNLPDSGKNDADAVPVGRASEHNQGPHLGGDEGEVRGGFPGMEPGHLQQTPGAVVPVDCPPVEPLADNPGGVRGGPDPS